LDVRIRPVVDQLTTILPNDDAATSVEYAILLALIILTAFGAIQNFGSQMSALWSGMVNSLQALGFF
jgi:Flp pilus assembly pilin Flp